MLHTKLKLFLKSNFVLLIIPNLMKKYYTKRKHTDDEKIPFWHWLSWIAAILILVYQEEYYFKTLCSINIFGVNFWEYNRFLPSGIIFLFLFTFLCITPYFLKKFKLYQLRKKFEDKINVFSLGIVALISGLIFFTPLYLNYKFRSSIHTTNTKHIFNII